MGGGSREDQYSTRFDGKKPPFEESISEEITDRYVFGRYIVELSSDTIYVYYKDNLLSIYPKEALRIITDKYIKIKNGGTRYTDKDF